MMPTAAAEQVVREVVRGERPWTDLHMVGVEIPPDKAEVHSPKAVAAKVDIHDLARGFFVNRHDPEALRSWAFVMEALDADFEAVMAHPSAEAIWDAIWTASFGDPVDETRIRLIEQLARERTSPA